MTAKKIFIGLDAHSATLLDSMMADGVAPNLQKLASRSRRIKIENYTGMGDGVFCRPSRLTTKNQNHRSCPNNVANRCRLVALARIADRDLRLPHNSFGTFAGIITN